MNIQRIGMVGYGEVGKIFSAALQSHVAQVSAWDTQFDPEATPVNPRNAALAHAAQAGVHAGTSLQDLCEGGVDCIISAVTASSTLAVAQAAAPYIRVGTVFLDLNSASPGTKQQAAQLIDAVGGHYVEPVS
jgi:3-hydroxyisobutyrate dehydrogenase-like beta-hydroxyacid dehydrogenase